MVVMYVSVYSRQHRMSLENAVYPRQVDCSIGLLCTDTFMWIELNKVTIDVATICFTPCKVNISLFYNILIHRKGMSIW